MMMMMMMMMMMIFLLRAPFGQYGPVAALYWALVCVPRHDSRPGPGGVEPRLAVSVRPEGHRQYRYTTAPANDDDDDEMMMRWWWTDDDKQTNTTGDFWKEPFADALGN